MINNLNPAVVAGGDFKQNLAEIVNSKTSAYFKASKWIWFCCLLSLCLWFCLLWLFSLFLLSTRTSYGVSRSSRTAGPAATTDEITTPITATSATSTDVTLTQNCVVWWLNIHTFATVLGIKVWLKKTLFILCPNKLGRNAREHLGGQFYDILLLTKSSLSLLSRIFLQSREFLIPVLHR